MTLIQTSVVGCYRHTQLITVKGGGGMFSTPLFSQFTIGEPLHPWGTDVPQPVLITMPTHAALAPPARRDFEASGRQDRRAASGLREISSAIVCFSEACSEIQFV